MKYLKFLILDDNISLGYVEYHKFLLPKDYKGNIHGGGLIITDEDSVILHGYSTDYGPFYLDKLVYLLSKDKIRENFLTDLELVCSNIPDEFSTGFKRIKIIQYGIIKTINL